MLDDPCDIPLLALCMLYISIYIINAHLDCSLVNCEALIEFSETFKESRE